MRRESPTNTPEQVEQYLQSALDLIGRMEIPDDLRVPAFSLAAQWFAAKHVFFDQPQPVAMHIPRGL